MRGHLREVLHEPVDLGADSVCAKFEGMILWRSPSRSPRRGRRCLLDRALAHALEDLAEVGPVVPVVPAAASVWQAPQAVAPVGVAGHEELLAVGARRCGRAAPARRRLGAAVCASQA